MEFLRTDGICESPEEARHVQFVVRRMTIVSHCHDPLVGGSDPKKLKNEQVLVILYRNT